MECAGPLALAGLSPRVRGNPRGRRAAAAASGSIPACAGEPAPYLCLLLLYQVYPRVCGGTPTRRG